MNEMTKGELENSATRIKLLLTDVDGVLTDSFTSHFKGDFGAFREFAEWLIVNNTK